MADHLVLAIDAAFPDSQPRIFAPAAGSNYSWPHVEQAGLLCLRPSRNAAPIADRVVTHLCDAVDLLNFPSTFQKPSSAKSLSESLLPIGRIGLRAALTKHACGALSPLVE